MPLSDIVNVQITVQSGALTLPGFGRPLVLPPSVPFAERLKIYSDPDEALADGFLTSDQAYLELVALFSQNPRPVDAMVGRRDPAVAMVRTFRVLSTADGVYTITLNGHASSFTASGDTASDIRTGLVAAINANPKLAGKLVAAPVGTIDLTVTASVAGISFVSLLTAPAAGGVVFVQTVDVTGAPDGTYTITIGNTPNTYQAVGDAEAAISLALTAAVDANTGSHGVDATDTGTALDLTSVNDFSASVSAPGGNLDLNPASEWIANVGIPEALAAITDANPDWYLLLITERTDPEIETAARYIETVRKVFLAQSSDTQIVDVPFDPGNIDTDIAARLHGLGLARTGVVYHPNNAEPLAAPWAGRLLPEVPASNTWKFKTLRAIGSTELSTTQLNNLRGNPQTTDQGKAANAYVPMAGRNITIEGTVAGGEFLDVVRGIDKLHQDIQARTAGTLLRNPKVPFTQAGIQLLAADTDAALKASTREGLVATSRVTEEGETQIPAYTVTPPAISEIPIASREKRLIPAANPIRFEATLAGAIHVVNVNGTLSV